MNEFLSETTRTINKLDEEIKSFDKLRNYTGSCVCGDMGRNDRAALVATAAASSN